MNNRTTSASFTYSDGEWTQVPSGTLTVKNGASCEVRVSFKFEAVKQ
jgi:hypothetical protein